MNEAFLEGVNPPTTKTPQTSSADAVRAAARKLAERGVRDPNSALRHAAAAVCDRACAAFDAGTHTVAWLDVVVRDGASRLHHRDTPSDLLRELAAAETADTTLTTPNNQAASRGWEGAAA